MPNDAPADFIPGPRDRGLASAGPRQLAEATIAAWDEFLQLLDSVDLDARTRNSKVRAREIVASVGSWPEGRSLNDIVDDALTGSLRAVDQDEINARVEAAHAGDSRAELIAGVERSRDRVSDWISGRTTGLPPFDEVAMLESGSPLGPLPVVTYLNAGTFQLAVFARDLRPAGAEVPGSLELAGLKSLVDTTGALAARLGIEGRLAAITPAGAVATSAVGTSWITALVDPQEARTRFPGVEGEAGLLLDIASGRKNPVGRLRKRDITIRELPKLMRFAPIASDVPGLPGGPVLRKAAGFLSVWSKRP